MARAHGWPSALTKAWAKARVRPGFTNTVFSRDGIAPGDGGRTSLRLPDPLQSGRTYYWRARAQDGANTGPYSGPANFDVFTPIVIERPEPMAPAVNAVQQPLRPTFVVSNAPRSGPVGAINYQFELADTEFFINKVGAVVPEQPNQTSIAVPGDLAYDTVYFWHARAFDPTTTGDWSITRAFRTMTKPLPPPVVSGFGSFSPYTLLLGLVVHVAFILLILSVIVVDGPAAMSL